MDQKERLELIAVGLYKWASREPQSAEYEMFLCRLYVTVVDNNKSMSADVQVLRREAQERLPTATPLSKPQIHEAFETIRRFNSVNGDTRGLIDKYLQEEGPLIEELRDKKANVWTIAAALAIALIVINYLLVQLKNY